jgi:tetratricopeptide (TPR) repeat protein
MRRQCLILIGTCILAVVVHGCSRHRSVAVTSNPTRAQKTNNTSSPASLSDYIRAVLKISQENTAAADEALKQLYERRPELDALSRRASENGNDVDSRRRLAAAYMREGLYPYAFQMYQEIQAIRPGDALAELGVAQIWDRWGDYNLARQHAERAVTLDPKSFEALEGLGRIHLHRNELDQALSAFLSALDVSPESPSLLSNIGYTFLSRGNFPQARTYLERAVEIDGSLSEARNNLGIVLAQLGDHDGALRQFMAVNDPAIAFNNIGAVYLGQKRWGQARDAFERALALDPSYLKAKASLSEVKMHLPPPMIINLPAGPADDNSALAASRARSVKEERASRFNPERGSRITTAYRDALNRFRARRYQQAVDIFQWLLEQYPNDTLASNCQYWTGESYFGLGNYKEAHAAFKRVTEYSGSLKRNDALVMMRRANIRQRQKERQTNG